MDVVNSPLDKIRTLEAAREQFHEDWFEARQSAAFGLDLEDLGDDPPDDVVVDTYEERHHCGTCTVNYVGGKLESTLMDYLRLLEAACGLGPEG